MIKKGFQINVYKIISLVLENNTLPINCILISLITYFMFEA
jgi:hypothetical protein